MKKRCREPFEEMDSDTDQRAALGRESFEEEGDCGMFGFPFFEK
jgi:hypothetical protein